MSLFARYARSRSLVNSFVIATASGCLLLVAFGGCSGGSDEPEVISKRARIEIPADVVPGRPEPGMAAAPPAEAALGKAEGVTTPVPAPQQEAKAPVAADSEARKPAAPAGETARRPATGTKVAKTAPSGGTWAINVASFSSKRSATDLSDGLRKAGFSPYVTEFVKDNRLWYRVRVGFFKTRDDAVATGGRIKSRFNVGSAWVVQPSADEVAAHSDH